MIQTSGGDHIFLNSEANSEIMVSMHSGEAQRPRIQRVWGVSKVSYFTASSSGSLLSKDALTWTITETDASGLQYRVRFKNSHASDKFAVLANLWTPSRYSGEYNKELYATVLDWARNLEESEEAAITEIDVVTSSVALFANSE